MDRIGLSKKYHVTDHEDSSLSCFLEPGLLDYLYEKVKIEAEEGWENPDNLEILQFDSAFLPHSDEIIIPIIQLQGVVAARLDRKKRNLPPAYATPGYVFGYTDQPKS